MNSTSTAAIFFIGMFLGIVLLAALALAPLALALLARSHKPASACGRPDIREQSKLERMHVREPEHVRGDSRRP